MKHFKKILGIAVGIVIVVLFTEIHGCSLTRFMDSTVSFSDLPKEVQDTVLYWTENYSSYFTNSDSLINTGEGTPWVICFDEKYIRKGEKFGPWQKNIILIRVSDGKKYKFSRDTPEPFIVRNDSLFIPTEYNILTVWNQSAKWRIHKLR